LKVSCFFYLVRMQAELENILGRRVDPASKRAIASSRNPLPKRDILNLAEVFYEAWPGELIDIAEGAELAVSDVGKMNLGQLLSDVKC